MKKVFREILHKGYVQEIDITNLGLLMGGKND